MKLGRLTLIVRGCATVSERSRGGRKYGRGGPTVAGQELHRLAVRSGSRPGAFPSAHLPGAQVASWTRGSPRTNRVEFTTTWSAAQIAELTHQMQMA